MKPEVFDAIVQRRVDKIKTVLASKAKEYATEDRLHNFKRAANFTNEPPTKVCAGFMMKHLVSVMDIVDALNAKRSLDALPSREVIDEKIGDAINYFILLEALFVELLDVKESPAVEA